MKRVISIRFYEELNDFLKSEIRKKWINYTFRINQTVKDAIEAMGVPHAEIDLIVVNGESVGFDYHLQDGDQISVYPVFETLDISTLTLLRPEPLRETRFILDVHLGKLCKYLRMLGFDTYYRNDLADDEIVKISVTEKRIILTRDLGILKIGAVTHGYWIRSKNSKEQLFEVFKRFDLKDKSRPFYRCTMCNNLVKEVKKTDIEHLLKMNTKIYFDKFYQCNDCKRVYWEGTHFKNMQNFIQEITGK